jgi:hypothetical protein
MTRDDIIRMAREAGFNVGDKFAAGSLDDLKHFEALIRADERSAEREACAKVCDEVGNRDANTHAWDAAAAIRARGQT